MRPTYRLLAACPDRVGIVAALGRFVAERGGNITEASHHQDHASGGFFVRQAIDAASVDRSLAELRADFAPVAAKFEMRWQITDSSVPKRLVLLASRQDHCLADLLYRWRRGELAGEIVAVLSNHPDLEPLVAWHGIPFAHCPIAATDKTAGFTRLGEAIERYAPDGIVLARYMQILPAFLCARYAGRVINIHHSFLPSFVGARPYHQAFERGVKLVGATCHFVTEALDAGPIIEQDVIRVSHRDAVEDMIRRGRDVERLVLARGVQAFLEDRVVIHGDKTVLLD